MSARSRKTQPLKPYPWHELDSGLVHEQETHEPSVEVLRPFKDRPHQLPEPAPSDQRPRTVDKVCARLIALSDDVLHPLLQSKPFRIIAETIFKEDSEGAWDKLFRIIWLLRPGSIDPERIKRINANRGQSAKELRKVALFLKDYPKELTLATARQFSEAALARNEPHPELSSLLRSAAGAAENLPKLLERVAKLIKKGPLPNDLLSVSVDKIGRRGGLAKGDASSANAGRRRAAIIREMDSLIPSSVSNRHAIIAHLLTAAGIKTTRQQVRGTLLKGRT
jgi:hypothetical protein